MTTMAADEPSSIQTRPSLLHRLKTGDHSESWQEFYRIYGKLARDFALQAGLTDTEADEVVQETAIAMAKHLPEYDYNPKVCRFKTWLLNQTSWRIKDQLKKRRRNEGLVAEPLASSRDDTTRTSADKRVADAAADLDSLFEKKWRQQLLATALERVKVRFTLKQFQMFDLTAYKEWSADEVGRSLGVSVANVYVTKHRFAAALRKEIARLERLT
ncbi:MAG TPA: sigma-70 family RNA polymerase sigma factor [Verrucomicrobiota bacterium]|nr:RNA polymerase subunit sigma [Verrucomicrobiales bacterium]HRI13032.1 sigma-70 family RNA polymerase sigma factor [Verrucomicrobiota bacterium]